MLTQDQVRQLQEGAARMEAEAYLMCFRAEEMQKIAADHYERVLVNRERLDRRRAAGSSSKE